MTGTILWWHYIYIHGGEQGLVSILAGRPNFIVYNAHMDPYRIFTSSKADVFSIG